MNYVYSSRRTFRSPRSESHLTVTMAEELKSAEKYREALALLQPVMEHYRREKWRPLLDAVLSLGLKCAYLLADAEQGHFSHSLAWRQRR